MGRAPCCDKENVKKGPWSREEDLKLKDYIEKNGTGGNWIAFPQRAGLNRCGKSCRLRWLNYLRPNIKHGEFSDEEDRVICTLFATIGSRWSIIAAQLPGRTDNDIKNYWNTKLKKKLRISMAPPPPCSTHHKIKPPTSAILPLIPSHHQTSSSSLAPLYKDCTPSNISSSDLWKYPMTNPSNSPSQFQFQDGGSMMSKYCYPNSRKESMVFIFGSSEASCSSSEFSSYNSTRGIKQEDLVTLQSCCYNNSMSSPTLFEDNNNKNKVSDQNVNQLQYLTDKATNGLYGETASPILDYDVKRQLSSSYSNINCIEENKTEVEKAMYNYYY